MVPKILIIDDNVELAENMREIIELEHEGAEVSIAPSGERGLELLGDQPFDLVITDMRMPGLSGLDVVRHLREHRPAIPALVMTAYAEERLLDEVRRRGALGVVVKPVDLESLVDFVRNVTEARSRVLLVEDDDQLRAGLVEALNEIEGLVVMPAASQEDARRMAREIDFAASIVDIRLPDGDGRDLIDALGEHPIVFITGLDAESLANGPERAGKTVTRVMEKPFRPEALVEALRDVLAS